MCAPTCTALILAFALARRSGARVRLVYLGTPAAAVPPLVALLAAHHEIVAVVTRPDAPRSRRGRGVSASPVKAAARAAGLAVIEPTSGRDPVLLEGLIEAVAHHGATLAVTCAFGYLLPDAVLRAVPGGFINVHFSLLPAYRGAAPVQHAILDGRQETGVTIFQLDAGMDTGPVLSRRALPITAGEDAGALTERLAHLGAGLLVETLQELHDGRLSPRRQDDDGASLAPKLRREGGRLDFATDADAVVRQVRAYTPNPGAWTVVGGSRLAVLQARAESGSATRRPNGVGEDHDEEKSEHGVERAGTVLGVDGAALRVASARGVVRLELVQPAGRRAMSGADFARGARLSPGAGLDDRGDGNRGNDGS